MTITEMIKVLDLIKEAIAYSKELTETARYRAYLSVEDAIEQIHENED